MFNFFLWILTVVFFFDVSYCDEDRSDNVKGQGRYKSRIAGGHSVDIIDHPYQVQLFPTMCGGTIIERKWIVSAWICNHPNLTVLVGHDSIEGITSGNLKVERVYRHKSKLGEEYPIMLIKLQNHLNFTETINKIEYRQFDYIPNKNMVGIVAGFGATDKYINESLVLHAVEISIFTHDKCLKKLPDYKNVLSQKPEVDFCAGYDRAEINSIGGQHAPCKGDFGSGLISENSLIGVAISNRFCGYNQEPGVFASVPFAKNWIESTQSNPESDEDEAVPFDEDKTASFDDVDLNIKETVISGRYRQILTLRKLESYCLGKSSGYGGYKSRIAGGHIAFIRHHRHHVRLFPTNCGGTIIGTRYILSAWSCKHDNLIIIAGFDQIEEGTRNHSVKSCDQAFLNQGRPFSERFQTMLITLNEDLIFGENICSVRIESQRIFYKGQIGTIAGFGSTDQRSDFRPSKYLRAVEIPVFSHDACVKKYENYRDFFKEKKDHNLELCGGYDWSKVSNMGGHHSFCAGDIGSGLIINGYLVGVAVRNYGCSRGKHPGIFETLWYLKTWMNDRFAHDHCVKYSVKSRYDDLTKHCKCV